MRNIDLFYNMALQTAVHPDKVSIFSEILQSVPKIRMQQAADYWHTIQTATSKDIPNIAPPWKSFYFEYRVNGNPIAGLVQTDKLPDGKWGVLVTFALIMFDKVVRMDAIDFQINADGSRDEELGWSMHNLYSVPSYGITKKEADDAAYVFLTPLFLGLCFCHCSTQIEMQTEEVSKKLIERHINENKVIVERWHILNIEPVKKMVEAVRKASNTGIKMALHLCRGHFSNYKDGRGLFGKYHGVYWMPPTFKGNKNNGVVKKEYAI